MRVCFHGDGLRSLPAHVKLNILGLIPEDAHHVRQPDACLLPWPKRLANLVNRRTRAYRGCRRGDWRYIYPIKSAMGWPSFPGLPGRFFEQRNHFRLRVASRKNQGDILGEGHKSLPSHVYLNILGLIPEDAHHVRQPDAYQNKQGDDLGDGNRSLPAHV